MSDLRNDRKAYTIIIVFSAIVLSLILFLGQADQSENIPYYIKWLPTFNATVNGTCFILLLFSLYAIKNKKIELHKKLNLTALLLSGMFLVSYVIFHSYGIETKFPAENSLRPLYLIVLISHIILAALVLPLILISFYFGLQGNIVRHRKIVRFSYPIWLYVTLSGVIVYLMISPYYSF